MKQLLILLYPVVMLVACSPATDGINENHQSKTSQHTSIAESSASKYEKLDQYFELLEENNKLMAAIAIRKDGKLVYERAIGYADVDNSLKTNVNSKFRIGSITKSFTAVLVMQMIEDGKLSLSQKLSDFFPAIPNASQITIQQLLSHKSGIFNFTNAPEYPSYMETEKSKAELLDIISAFPAEFTPGEKFSYSNSNYVLLGFILEELSNETYANLIAAKIAKPLGLENTYVGAKIDTKNDEVLSYRFVGEWSKATETSMSIPLGAGAMVSTAADISAFFHALNNGQLVGLDTLSKMKKVGEYGFGLMSYPFYDKVGFGHNGGIDGFVSNGGVIEGEDVTMAVLANGVNYTFNDVLVAMLSSVFEKPFELPVFKKHKPVSNNLDLSIYEGVYESEQIPLKITVFIENEVLMAQASGQDAFTLEPSFEHGFAFKPAGILMEFEPAKNRFTLNQGGGKFNFTKI
ncbi:beta-lactamase family protein [Psychrosphaera sp.]|nr:beta-lactamase family protein [Psychrosphaera sp.]